MSAHAYTEDHLVEQPAIALFAELRWQTVSAIEEVFWGHPVKQWVLKYVGHAADDLAPFAHRLMEVVEGKFNRHLYDGRLEGYGVVLFPRAPK